MQPLNQRSEKSSSSSPANSNVGDVSSNGTDDTSSNQYPAYQPRQSALERRAQKQQQQQKQNQQQDDDEPRRVSLAELFADGTDDSDEDGESDDPSQPPETFDLLSKRLGLKPEQLYNVKIPLRDGAEPLTIGQLKDRVGEVVDLETRELQFEQRRMQSEGELLRSQAEIREILAMIPKEHIKPEVVEKIRKRHDANMATERRMTLEHIPEWRDEKRRAEDLQGMIEFMGNYGFDDTFIGTVSDHRAIKFIRDMYIRDKRIQKALSQVTTPDTRGQRGSAKTKKAPRSPNQHQPNTQRRHGVQTQRSRIAAIFNKSE